MWVQVSVLYRSLLAKYDITKRFDGSYIAKLCDYKGNTTPPHELSFVIEGRHCTGDTGETELMDDLHLAYQQQVKAGH